MQCYGNGIVADDDSQYSMVKFYENGADFLHENIDILRERPLETTFFEVNAQSISRCDDTNFAVRAEAYGELLLCVHIGDYPAVLFGSVVCAQELAQSVAQRKLNFSRTLGAEDVSLAFWKEYESIVGGSHKINFSMDVMTCNSVVPCDVSDVVCATPNDAEQIARLSVSFAADATRQIANLQEIFQRVRRNISAYRCVKRDGKAVSVAAVHEESNGLTRISEVYTLPEYRNKGFARQTVTSFTADILKCGRTPYLHVDKTNPVSNRLYLSIGYVYGTTKLEIERVAAS